MTDADPTDDLLVAELEEHLRQEASRLVAPVPGQCLLCYLARTLDDLGCDSTLRFARHYRDVLAPRAVGLERRLGSVGGYCDCEVFLNGYCLAREHWVRDLHTDELDQPPHPPPCHGARTGSTKPCSLWVRWRHWS